jgi:beta-glucosidase
LFRDRSSGLSAPDDRIAEAVAAVRNADAAILCVGLDATLEGEEGDASNAFASGDKTTLSLPGRQQVLMEKVAEASKGKPLIVVALSGSALDLSWADARANAVVQVFYPGAQGGLAVAELLFGECAPEGKLPLTFYKSDADLPDFREYAMQNRTYRYFNGEPLYPFGYGLGYDCFTTEAAAYVNGRLTITTINNGPRYADAVKASYMKNAVTETLQVYAAVEGTKERWNLCGMAKVSLRPGERAMVAIDISPAAFSRYDANGDLQPCAGKKRLYVGFSQPDARSIALTGTQPAVIEVEG